MNTYYVVIRCAVDGQSDGIFRSTEMDMDTVKGLKAVIKSIDYEYREKLPTVLSWKKLRDSESFLG